MGFAAAAAGAHSVGEGAAMLARRLPAPGQSWLPQPAALALRAEAPAHSEPGLDLRGDWNQAEWVAYDWKPEGDAPVRPVRGAAVAAHARRLMARERARMRRGRPGVFPGRLGERWNGFGLRKRPGLQDSWG